MTNDSPNDPTKLSFLNSGGDASSSINLKNYEIHWKSHITDAFGFTNETHTFIDAIKIINYMNNLYPELEHWVQRIK